MLERPCGEARQREEKMHNIPCCASWELLASSHLPLPGVNAQSYTWLPAPTFQLPQLSRSAAEVSVPRRRAPNADSLAKMSTSATSRASLMVQTVENLPAMQEAWVRSLGWEDHLNKKMTTYSSILAWRSPWTEEPGRPVGLQRVGHE